MSDHLPGTDPEFTDVSRAYGGGLNMAVDMGLRSYMLGVYNHMLIAMLISGGVAMGASSSPALMKTLFGTPLMWVVIFAPIIFMFIFMAKVLTMAPATARMLFYVFAGVMGLSISSIFVVYTGMSIAKVFFITAAAFGGLSLYGYTTKRDLSGMGTFLIMGVWGLLIAGLVNMFLKSPALDFAYSALGVLIFAGLTAYDTQNIKRTYYAVANDAAMAARMSVVGALQLYMDFLNLFMFLLKFMGSNRE